MGGRFSGRRRGFAERLTTDDFYYVCIKHMKDAGCFACLDIKPRWQTSWFDDGKVLEYRAHFMLEEKGKDIILTMWGTYGGETYQTHVQYTEPCYGGRRYWLCCPTCKERTTKLYYHLNKPLRCRKCWKLVYRCQHQRKSRSQYRRAANLHRRLGGDGDVLGSIPDRPRYMHRKTYRRLDFKMWHLYLSARYPDDD